MLPLLVVLFVLSGAAGLIYESIWTRYLALFVGHSAYAQMLVLVIFLGGMSAGALAVGRRAEKIRDPLLAYALIEALIGVMGLGFHALYRGATALAYDVWFPALAGSPMLHVVQWTLAGLLILPQSILLGATFPLMSAAVLRRRPQRAGHSLALLYFANSLGAAAGALVAGFALLAWVGLPGTVAVAGALNLLVAGIVLAARGRERSAAPDATSAPAPEPEPARSAADGTRLKPPKPAPPMTGAPASMTLLLGIAFGTAVASFCYEIAWIRLLSLLMGSATHSFEIMLSAFILGLALGAAWVRGHIDRFRDPVRALAWIQCAMALSVIATLPVAVAAFGWVSLLIRSLPHTDGGYLVFGLARYGIALAVMLPATFCAGMTLPLITRIGIAREHGESAIGLVYGVNTLGSIVGATLAGLVLMPALGLKGVLIAGALLDAALGVWAMRAHERAAGTPVRLAWRVALACAVALAAAATLHLDRAMITSGVYRHGRLLPADSTEVPFYRDGRTASVAVRRWRSTGELSLTTNGKPDASAGPNWLLPPGERVPLQLGEDEATQVGIAVLALAHARHAREVAIIGQGSGMTTHLMLGGASLGRVVTIEIEPEVIAASRAFYPANARVFEDPRSSIVLDDARSYLSAEGHRWDLIVSEPSNPCVSGVAGLFSTEFYGLARRHLAADGVLVQWLHLYELDDDLVLGVLGALQRNFRDYDVFLLDANDLAIVATNSPGGLRPDWSAVEDPGIAADLRHIPPYTPDVFEAMRAGGHDVLAPLVTAAGRVNSDFRPVLDLGAERARFLDHTASGFISFNAARYSLTTVLARRALGFAATPFVPAADLPRWRQRAIGAAMRAGMSPRGDYERDMTRAYQRARDLSAAFAPGAPAPDWREWTGDALGFEQDIHGGTAGVADERFFVTLTNAALEHGAPDTVLTVLGFARDLARWDFATAVARADTLIGYTEVGAEWIATDRLLDGAVAAHLALGDTTGAVRAATRLAPYSKRAADDLRTRLFSALTAPDANVGRAKTRRGSSKPS